MPNLLEALDKSDWQTFRFDDIAHNISKRVEPGATDLTIYVGLEHLDSGSLQIKRMGTPADVDGTKLLVYAGDVIFGRRRAYQRKAAVATFDGICSAHALVLRAKPEVIEPRLFPFFLHSDAFMHRVVDISVGGLSPTVNWGHLKVEEFLLPPRDQQARLSELLWAADEVGEKYRAALENAQACFDLLNDTAFLNPSAVFSTYEEIELEECCMLQTGIAKGKQYEDEVERVTLPYLRVANVQDGHIDLSEIKEITVSLKEAKRFALQAGDVLLTEGGDFDKLGRGAVWNAEINECLHQNHVFCVRPDLERLNSQFVSTQTGSSYGKSYFLINAKKTSNLASINSTQVKKFPMIVPSLQEQEEFVQKSEAIKYQIQNIKNCIAQVKNVRQQLSNQIFSL